ncbi:asparagine--tRNA ligase, cytoplasmic 2 [Olea europaea subsp. europaea]|uniref:asparagine--tRNA ligase n=1 Tax=Olea europaea subsp. europaea TaxID=158383 RepID=A0A8S0TA41_OLEEU|nr:asparagine--tRNA ligase, cytoplasmic 2 [Olea europaea subsp. europaea]
METQLVLPKYSKTVVLKFVFGQSDGGVRFIGQRVVVGGWVKSSRAVSKDPVTAAPDAGVHKDVTCVEILQSRFPFFRSILKVLGGAGQQIRDKLDTDLPMPPQLTGAILQVSDGSCVANLQVVVDSSLAPPGRIMPIGTCILAEGILQQPSTQGKQIIELKAEKILHIGTVDQDRYPLSKRRLPMANLRDSAHFRQRTTTVASVMRIRSALTQATHTFFQENGFLFVQVPIITSTDCEGASENFQVTTLSGKGKIENQSTADDAGGVELEVMKVSIEEKTKQVEELKRTDSNKEALAAAIQDLKKTTELVSQLEAKEKAKSGKPTSSGNKDKVSEDFFSCQTFLTVSGCLHLESYACALGKVYSFGPRFRANKIESRKSLSEAWMVELQMAFSEIEDAVDCADDFLKFICKWILENSTEDLKFLSKRIDNTIVDRLQLIATGVVEYISYTEAIEFLNEVTEKQFETKVEWGVSLSEEHESYLADEIYKKPVIMYNHPKEIKPFYTRLNDDEKTVAAFDVIVPKVGTLIRGSQNEERFNVLSTRITEMGLAKEQYEWYLDLRRHGTAKCSGFTFLFDSLVLYATGLDDVRDAVPFPRSFGKANN